jgi:hypothetical protein
MVRKLAIDIILTAMGVVGIIAVEASHLPLKMTMVVLIMVAVAALWIRRILDLR